MLGHAINQQNGCQYICQRFLSSSTSLKDIDNSLLLICRLPHKFTSVQSILLGDILLSHAIMQVHASIKFLSSGRLSYLEVLGIDHTNNCDRFNQLPIIVAMSGSMLPTLPKPENRSTCWYKCYASNYMMEGQSLHLNIGSSVHLKSWTPHIPEKISSNLCATSRDLHFRCFPSFPCGTSPLVGLTCDFLQCQHWA